MVVIVIVSIALDPLLDIVDDGCAPGADEAVAGGVDDVEVILLFAVSVPFFCP